MIAIVITIIKQMKKSNAVVIEILTCLPVCLTMVFPR